ncbi:MAG: hypothetical protein EA401_00435 [Planctomycetota bacterium]|nr:MAG: hypothetical protein EA401_00435 [Planctomycetota bacterium]
MDHKTFNCPHCGAVYPFKPALVNRAVRCSACKEPFRLQANGAAEKVNVAAAADSSPATAPSQTMATDYGPHASHHRPAAPRAASADSSDAHQPISARHHQTDAAITPRRRPSDGPIPLAAKTAAPSRTPSRLNDHQERTRRLMTSTLNQAATLALAKAAEQDTTDAIKSERISRKRSGVRHGAAVKTSDGKELGPAVLSGEGERRRRMPWWLTVSILALMGFIFLWAFWPANPASRTLIQFGAGQAAFLAGSGGARMSARQTLVSPGGEIQPISHLRQHRIGAVETISLAPLQEAVGHLRSLGYFGLWIEEGARSRALRVIMSAESAQQAWRREVALLTDQTPENSGNEDDSSWWQPSIDEVPDLPSQPPSPREALDAAAQSAGWEMPSEEEVRQRIRDIPNHGSLLLQLWQASDSVLLPMVEAGNLPQRISLRPFTGQDARWHMGFGDPVAVPYEGRLIRLSGGSGDDRWRILDLRVRQ